MATSPIKTPSAKVAPRRVRMPSLTPQTQQVSDTGLRLVDSFYAHLTHIFQILYPDLGKSKASEELETQGASEEAVPEDKEIVPEGVMEEGTSDSNTGSETTSAQTEDVPVNEPSEGLGKARAAH